MSVRRLLTKLNLFKPVTYPELTSVKNVYDDTYNKVKDGEIKIDFIHLNKNIGYIQYRLNGQIGLFYLDDRYRNLGIGKDILINTIEDMKKNNININEVWAVSSKDHPFWSNVFNKSFRFCDEKTLHPSITGDGYKMNLR